MLFLPIGHDQAIRRFPALTVAIMVICTLVQIARLAFGPSTAEVSRAILDREQAEEAVVARYVAAPPMPDDDPDDVPGAPSSLAPPPPVAVPPELVNDTQKLLEEVRARRFGDPNDPAVLALHQADARYAELAGRDLAQRFGYRPSSKLSINLLLCAFVHGGFLHLAGNLLFLWLCGCNLEDRWGRPVFAGLWLVSAIAASVAYALVHPGSNTPLVGASGAIAGTMGAFLVCFHDARIRYWYWMWWRPFKGHVVHLPAYVAFPVWFLAQVGQSFLEASGYDEVAYSAHVGGFVAGVAIAVLLKVTGIEKAKLLPSSARGVEWEEDPDFVRAMELASASPAEAIALLRKVLERDPKRDDVRFELCRVAIGARDVPLVEATATRTFLWLGEQSRWSDAVELFAALEASGIDKPLSDRAYSVVVRASIETSDPKLCVRAATKLQSSHPNSPLLPRALWDVARAQSTAGRDDLARKTLTRLIETYPEHAFAEEARRKLAGFDAGAR